MKLNLNLKESKLDKVFKISFSLTDLRDYSTELVITSIQEANLNTLDIIVKSIEKFATTTEEAIYITLILERTIIKSLKAAEKLVDMFDEMYKTQNN